MKIIIALIVVLITATNALPCVQAVEATDINVGINIGGTWGRVFFADLSTKSRKQQEVEIMERLQSFLDERIPLSALVLDEPSKLEDPAEPGFFWSDADGKTVDNPLDATHITGRSCVIKDVRWSDELQTFIITQGTL